MCMHSLHILYALKPFYISGYGPHSLIRDSCNIKMCHCRIPFNKSRQVKNSFGDHGHQEKCDLTFCTVYLFQKDFLKNAFPPPYLLFSHSKKCTAAVFLLFSLFIVLNTMGLQSSACCLFKKKQINVC